MCASAVTKSLPVEPTSTKYYVVACGANSGAFMGVSNENRDAEKAFGVDESRYFVGLVGTGGVSLLDMVKTDGAGGFIVGTAAGSKQVAQAMQAGAAGDYIEFKKLPVVVTVTTP